MLYQIIIAGVLLLLLLNVIMNMRKLRTPDIDAKVPQPAPLISVLVPARDEEMNIRNLLETLQQQDYPNFEILVLDDNSTDNTAAIVNEMAAADSRIHLLYGKPLPEDWAGKPFACYQLAQKAKGDWLLFVDADTLHEPHMLRSVLALAMEMKTTLLSGFPRQLAVPLSVKVCIPVMNFILLSFVPLWWLHRSKTPKPSVAIGQFFFFNKDEYWRMGGHQVVQGRIVEDVRMGIEVANHGGKHIAVDLSTVTSCHMYRDFGSMWRGLARSIYSVAALSFVGLTALVTAVIFFWVLPFFYLWKALFVSGGPLLWHAVIYLQIGLIMVARWIIDSRLKEPPVSIWFHPLGVLFYVLDVIYAEIRWVLSTGISWKERFYSKESNVE
jgi:chlorobactene glucosyltransferase